MKITAGADRGQTQFADSLRAVACLSVVACHYLFTMWVSDRAGLAARANTPPLPDGVTEFAIGTLFSGSGRFGVALFFLVSGFVIPPSLLRYGARGFLIARCWRILPTFWVSLGVVFVALAVAGSHFDRPLLPLPWSNVTANLILGPLLGVKSIVALAWTLQIEIVFYCFCAAAFARVLCRGVCACPQD